jgi:hypothetical protein
MDQMGAYDTAVACDQERESRRKIAVEALKQVKREIIEDFLRRNKAAQSSPDTGNRPLGEMAHKVHDDDVTVSTNALEVAASRCIASDDPRLKAN